MAARKFGDLFALEDIHASVVFLTRLPAPEWRHDRPLSASMWAFPIAGVLVATIAGACYAAFAAVGCPPAVAALAAVAALVLATGGLHEDGLADFADGAGGARENRLAIMADSRIGAFGAAALIVSVGGRAASIAAIGDAVAALGALVAAAAASRAAMPVFMAATKPAKNDGLAAEAGRPAAPVWISGLAAAVAIAVLAAPGGWAGCLAGAAAGVAATGWAAHRMLGGHTGDVLGAAQQAAEFLSLALIAAALAD